MIANKSLRPLQQVAVFGLLASALSAQALEYPVGKPQQYFGMEITAVYLQPITMEPEGVMRKAEESDIHLEADIKALKGNPNGFEEGSWIPYLGVKFEVTKIGSSQKVVGEFVPMAANDGPHYGDNIKLFGPGKYRVKYTILPPTEDKSVRFGRHVDRLTGVKPWFKPFNVENDFSYVGIGKKGGY